MQVILHPITTVDTESIIAMLRDAEEGEGRIRATVPPIMECGIPIKDMLVMRYVNDQHR